MARIKDGELRVGAEKTGDPSVAQGLELALEDIRRVTADETFARIPGLRMENWRV